MNPVEVVPGSGSVEIPERSKVIRIDTVTLTLNTRSVHPIQLSSGFVLCIVQEYRGADHERNDATFSPQIEQATTTAT